MKFREDVDAQAFMIEINSFKDINEVTSSLEPSKEQLAEFIKAREPYVSSIKDRKKSSAQKANWRKNKGKINRGIKAFHKSTKGKKFHRQLGRFLATRITREKVNRKEEDFSSLLVEKYETLKALNSAKQQLFIELDYYHTMDEQLQLESFIVDYAVGLFNKTENSIIVGEDLTLECFDFLVEIIAEDTLLLELSNRINVPVDNLTEVWNSIRVSFNNKEECTVDELIEEFNSNTGKL